MRRWMALLAVAGAAAFAPDAASAATTCEYDSGSETVTVTVAGSGGSAELELASGSEIRVRSFGPIVSCSGGTPTLSNTETIDVFDNGGFANTSIQQPSNFGSLLVLLASAEAPTSSLQLGGTASAEHIVFGHTGIDLDGDGNADLKYALSPPPGTILAGASGGADSFTARGGSGTGGPVDESTMEFADGSDGAADLFEGGEMGDKLDVENGPDVLRGFGGNDAFEYHAGGNHTIEGGEGSDVLFVPFISEPFSADLEDEAPQQTGSGTETLLQLENVIATSAGEQLFGNAAANEINAREGNDTVDGRAGDDTLQGSLGEDTVTYFDAKGPVEVDLGKGTATGAAGKDSLQGFEDLVGSGFGDRLAGSEGPNRIDGRGGRDTIEARGGDDLISARDGEADQVSCGPGTDTVLADPIDTVAADCEKVEPPPRGGGGGGGPLDFRLTAAAKQRAVERHGVKVKLRCPAEACAVAARAKGSAPKLGKTKTVRKQVPAGPALTIKVPLGKHALAALRRAFARGRVPRIKVAATATAAGAEPVSRTVTIKVKG